MDRYPMSRRMECSATDKCANFAYLLTERAPLFQPSGSGPMQQMGGRKIDVLCSGFRMSWESSALWLLQWCASWNLPLKVDLLRVDVEL